MDYTAKQKSFNVKIYNLSGQYQRTINPTDIMTPVSFSAQINGGLWELRLKVRASLTSTVVSYNSVIRIYETDTIQQTPRLIYSGIVGSLQRIADNTGSFLEIRAVGLASMLTWLLFKSGASYSFNKVQELATTMKEIVDSFSTTYPGLISYTGSTVQNTGITGLNIQYDYLTDLEALNKTIEPSTFWWTVDAAGLLHFHPKTGATGQLTHALTLGEDVDTLTIDENIEQLANRYIVKYSSWVTTANDTTSQGIYGIHEEYLEKTNITDASYALGIATSYVSKKKDMKRKISIQINDKYEIETIRPGDLVTLRNSEYVISALQIQKIEYNTDYIKVELDEQNSFTKELYN